METVVYEKGVWGGEVRLPPSKSVAHRALICGALSGGLCKISPIDGSADMEATFNFVRALGRSLRYDPASKTVEIGPGEGEQLVSVHCGESGSTLRFIIPIFAALGISAAFTGAGRLPQRPIGIYSEILRGVKATGDGLPYTIHGQLQSGDFTLPGNVSSQFITGLLFALPLLAGDSRILLATNLESEDYVNITLEVLGRFGIKATRTSYGYFVPGGQRYIPQDYHVEGDWSHAAFFLSMGAVSQNAITILGLKADSTQGDRRCVKVFREMGLHIEELEDGLRVFPPENGLKPVTADVSDNPDLAPALAATAALAKGRSRITGAARLRIKECDRLKAMADAINAIGGRVTELSDGLVIDGVDWLAGGFAEGCNDHRIVMSLAALAGASAEEIRVTDPWSIRKSYPDFYKDYVNLGGVLRVVGMGE